MADPRIVTPEKRAKHQHLSPLMQQMSRASKGEKINACPFDKDEGHLDDNGYCKHLVGFTDDKKLMEPLKTVRGRRVVVVERDQKTDGTEGPPKLEPVLPTDKLVQITTSFRVYREEPDLEALTKPDTK